MSVRYVAWRLVQVLPAVAGIVVIGFVLVHAAPGDPVLALAGDFGDPEYYRAMRDRFGLDEPLLERLVTYARRVLQGDFGTSYVQGRPALAVILERLPATLLLAATALALSSVLGLGLGTLAAVWRGRLGDLAVSAVVLTFFAAPVFWVGQLAILALAFHAGWFPVQGMTTAGSEASGLGRIVDVAHHLALPALVLASQQVAAVARLTRASLAEELDSDHVRTARSKGLPGRTVVLKHGLRRALLPVTTLIGGRLGFALSGAVVIEVVFSWPGIGQLMLSSIEARDVPVLMGIFFLVALAVLLANLITDLFYARLDPRIRYG
jgi:peptide/nickel transport system permease protein